MPYRIVDEGQRLHVTLEGDVTLADIMKANAEGWEHLATFLDAYNFAKRLKTLKGLTPYEHICTVWADEAHRFRYDPIHLTPGLNT